MSNLTEHLQTLEQFDLISPQPGETDLEYVFKHVFTQESVYQSLLRTDRRQLHQQVGQTLEAMFTASPVGRVESEEEQVLLLAYHFEKSGDQERALKYLKMAAANAYAAYTNREADELYSRALALLDKKDYARRWELLAEQEKALDRLGERERQAHVLTQLQTIADLMPDAQRMAIAYNRRAAYFDKISEYQAAAEAAEAGLRLARQINHKRLEAQSLNWLARAAWRRFDYVAVQQWANQALDALKIVADPATKTTSLLHLGRASYRLGQYDMALEYVHAAQEFVSIINDLDTGAVTDLLLGWIYQRLGDYDLSERHYQAALEKRRILGDRYGEATDLSHLGWLAYDQQRPSDGLRYCLEALDISQSINDRENEAYALSGLGLNHEYLGHTDEAQANYLAALKIHREIGAATLEIFDQLGLARLALAAQNLEEAQGYIQPVKNWILAGKAQQFWDPWSIYLGAYRVLTKLGEADAARTILTEAHTLLHQRAAAISNEDLRGCFFNKVAANREIEETWQQMKKT
jgi:tetratricopeptide (TPR) repeat protein